MSRRRLIQLALICGVAAVLTLLLGTIGSLRAFQMATLRAAPEASFEVHAAGPWVVASQTRGRLDGQPLVGEAITIDRLTIRDPKGGVVPLGEPDHVVRYHHTDRDGVVVGQFDATDLGSYRVRVAHGDGGILLAVGPDPIGPVSGWVLISGSIAIVLFGVACCFGWIAFRVSRG